MASPPSRRFVITGWVFAVSSLMLALRITWEKTILSWETGPQMVGYTVMHAFGLILLLGVLGTGIWILFYLVISVRRRSVGGILCWSPVVILLASIYTMGIPEYYWQRLFVDKFIAGGHASAFLLTAAFRGDIDTVRIFVSHGTSLKVCDKYGTTLLHSAAKGGSLEVIKYLLEHGANINALSRLGDSPMESAESWKRDHVVRYLSNHGGNKIRGSTKYREKITNEILQANVYHWHDECDH